MPSPSRFIVNRPGLLLLLLLSSLSPALGTTASWKDTSWTSVVHYRGQFQATGAADGILRITAIDQYALTFNGAAVGADGEWTTAETYPISIKNGSNEILVRVENHGQGSGSGLVIELEAGDLRLSSSIGNGPLPWQWSAGDPAPTSWNNAPFAQLGDLELARIAGLQGAGVPIAGFPGNVDLGRPGGLAISRVEGGNLALNKPASRIEVTDGLRETSWQPGVNALNKFVSMDLGQKRLINRVRVLTAPPRVGGSFADNSLKGYSVQISEDQFRWSEVGVLHGIEQFDLSQVEFPPVSTRYLRVVVAEIDGITSPQVGEIEVYGEGHHLEGSFESPPLDMGDPNREKNFGRVSWEAETPGGTQVDLQFRTSSDGQTWSLWSEEVSRPGSFFLAPEPAAFLQYRVQLSTRDQARSPRFKAIEIAFSEDEIPSTSARARISPTRVPMGVDTAFVLVLDLGPSQGAERLLIRVPGEASLEKIEGYSGEIAAQNTPQGLELSFSPPLTASVELGFRTALYSPTHVFSASLFSPGSDNPLNVEAATEGALSIFADQVLDQVLSGVRATPGLFTPNGDGINDFTVIEYTLAKVIEEVEVTVKIADLGGRTLRTLFQGGQLPQRFGRVSGSEELTRGAPGFWDGRDGGGNRVPPGIYLYSVKVVSDEENTTRTGTVSVVY